MTLAEKNQIVQKSTGEKTQLVAKRIQGKEGKTQIDTSLVSAEYKEGEI